MKSITISDTATREAVRAMLDKEGGLSSPTPGIPTGGGIHVPPELGMTRNVVPMVGDSILVPPGLEHVYQSVVDAAKADVAGGTADATASAVALLPSSPVDLPDFDPFKVEVKP